MSWRVSLGVLLLLVSTACSTTRSAGEVEESGADAVDAALGTAVDDAADDGDREPAASASVPPVPPVVLPPESRPERRRELQPGLPLESQPESQPESQSGLPTPPATPAADEPLDGSRSRLPDRPTRLGRIEGTRLPETSGLAVSQINNNRLWAINDSGNAPTLEGLNLEGGASGSWTVDARNRDWEDLDSVYIDGVPTLIVADTGDNRRRHAFARLWLIDEPEGASDTPLEARERRFLFEDGPRDVESMAVADGTIWLMSKEPPTGGTHHPARLYRLPLAAITAANDTAAGDTLPEAEFVAELWMPRPGFAARLAVSLAGVDLDQPTGLDIDESRGVAWLLTYQHVRRFDRRGEESWADTLSRAPDASYRHGLHQAEALAVTNEGLVVFTSEGADAPLYGLPPDWRS